MHGDSIDNSLYLVLENCCDERKERKKKREKEGREGGRKATQKTNEELQQVANYFSLTLLTEPS